MKTEKWYSNDLSKEEVGKLEVIRAKIKFPHYIRVDTADGELLLSMQLNYVDHEQLGTQIYLSKSEDIRQLLKGFNLHNISDVSKLEGKIIEAYVTSDELSGMLKGISVA